MPVNELFQYSVLSALAAGVANSGLPVLTLLSHGDMGLGTFRHMAGEMIVVDGRVYQAYANGSVAAVDVCAGDGDGPVNVRAHGDAGPVAPFAVVTRLEPTVRVDASFADLGQLADLLSDLFPRNAYLALRIDGTFTSATVRSVDGQRFAGEPLDAVTRRQLTHTLAGPVRATAVGFRSPPYARGPAVAADHVHLVTEDRSRGGHVLSLAAGAGAVLSAAEMSSVRLELPTGDGQFDGARMGCMC